MRIWRALHKLLRRKREPLSFFEFAETLQRAPSSKSREKLLSTFLNQVRERGAPLMEPGSRPGFDRMVFLYRGPAQDVSLSGDFSGLVPHTRFSHIAGTDLSYFAGEFETDARLDYKLVLNNGEHIFDPLNARISHGVFGANSQFWGSAYQAPEELDPNPRAPQGAVKEITFESRILKNTRAVKIYFPDVADSTETPGALYVHDGFDYGKVAGIATIADNLIFKRRVRPFVVILIPPVEREKEYDGNADFARAIAEELVPQIESQFLCGKDPKRRAVLGASLGGLMAAYQGAHSPHVFGNVASQSGAFLTDAIPRAIAESNCRDVKFHLDVGTYEANYFGKNLVEGNQRVHDALVKKSCRVQYHEVPEGHSWGSWRARVGEALRFFWESPN